MDYSGGLNKFVCDNSILAKKNKLIFFRLAEGDNKEGNKKIVIWKVALAFPLKLSRTSINGTQENLVWAVQCPQKHH